MNPAVDTPPEAPPSPAQMYQDYFGPAIFTPWSRVLLEHADPQPGEHVLDLACGTGIVARAVAARVGASGKVVGLDLRPGMLAVAASVPAATGAGIEWVQGDAVDPGLPDEAFDLVVCQQGLQFFADKVAALRHVRRMLRAGGRVAVNVWRGIECHPVFASTAEAEARALAELGVDESDSTMPFSLGSAEELRALFDQAGFARVEIVERTHDVSFPARGFMRSSAMAYAAVMPQFVEDPGAFERFVASLERDTAEILRRFTHGERIVFPMHAHVVTTQK